MFFTKEDYEKIKNYLDSNSIKDTEFDSVSLPLSGTETIVLVKDNSNYKITVSELINQLEILSSYDIINVTARYDVTCINLSEAISLIPASIRKVGMIIVFKDNECTWKIYQFQGERINQWNTVSLWKDIIQEIEITITSVPDEEDLTVTDFLIKFKDKLYSPDNYSGLGRVFLRKNVVAIEGDTKCDNYEVNLLTQTMFPYESTIYIIQYDYDLQGTTITIPENCTLLFMGGKISNGEIVLSDTQLLPNGMILENYLDVTISGTYAVGQMIYDAEEGKPQWWNGSCFTDASGS